MARRNQLNACRTTNAPAPLGGALVRSGPYAVFRTGDGGMDLYRIDPSAMNDAGIAVKLGPLADIHHMEEFVGKGARRNALLSGAKACCGLTVVGA